MQSIERSTQNVTNVRQPVGAPYQANHTIDTSAAQQLINSTQALQSNKPSLDGSNIL